MPGNNRSRRQLKALLINALAMVLVSIGGSTFSSPTPSGVNTVYITDSVPDPFSTTVDWYSRPPKGSVGSDSIAVPRELMQSVLEEKRAEAAKLLGDASAIPIDATQARELARLENPDVLLDGLLKNLRGGIKNLEEIARETRADFNKGTGFNIDEYNWQQNQASNRRGLEDRKRNLAKYLAWYHQLTPYLLKAVSLDDEGLGFHGTLVGRVLYVDQITPVTRKVPMRRMPVVAFLPFKPEKIYTSFTAVDWDGSEH